mmetsp:Transcript_19392/g.29768  ORF Transcript_19392/g.29768 Transcript_19392/m.29768 type:complete len:355 (-) Transcript_19392:470-1534(-)
MRSHSQELTAGRVAHGLVPLLGSLEGNESLAEIIVVEDGDITEVVAHGHVLEARAEGDASGLLVDGVGAQSGSSRLHVGGLVCLSVEQVVAPHLALLDALSVLDAVLVELVVVTAGQEGALVLDDLEAPRLSVVVRDTDHLLVGAVDINGLDNTVVVANQDLAIQDIEGGSEVIHLKRDSSQELVLTSLAREDGEHVVLTSGDKSALAAGKSGDVSSMSLQNEAELLLLIPNMDATVSTTRVADTILVEHSAVELGLGELGAEGTVLEKLLAGVGGVPELEGAGGDGDEFEVVCLLGPLNVENGVGTGGQAQQHLLSLNVVDVHGVVVALIDGGHVSLAGGDGESSHSLGGGAK